MTDINSPISSLVFNRLDTARQMFDAIRQAQPRSLYIASDRPRLDLELEAEKVQLSPFLKPYKI